MDLFDNIAPELEGKSPLARRAAPESLNDFSGQEHLVGPRGPLRLALESGRPMNAIFFGPPGCGKTSLARLFSKNKLLSGIEISCADSGLPKIREAITKAQMLRSSQGRSTLLLLDEIHHLNRTQQDILLPYMESGVVYVIGLTTENPFFYIHRAILSRALVYEFKILDELSLAGILDRALDALKGEGIDITLTAQGRDYLTAFAAGDARRLFNALEFLGVISTKQGMAWGPKELAGALGRKHILYDKKEDSHYDTASAFIKSMRGSDPDAAVYWMAKMLEGGEDPRFVARRIVIAASEDVGNADPMALVVAQSAFNAVEMLGLPEAAVPLAHAAIYVACAPKSNAAYLALKAAQKETAEGPPQEVPRHLKDASLDKALGHGKGYLYAHDYPEHFVEQSYMDKPNQFYVPTNLGAESVIRKRLETLWKRKYD